MHRRVAQSNLRTPPTFHLPHVTVKYIYNLSYFSACKYIKVRNRIFEVKATFMKYVELRVQIVKSDLTQGLTLIK